MITQFSKVIEYDYMTKVFDYNYDYNEAGLRLMLTYNFYIIFFSLLLQPFEKPMGLLIITKN